MTNLLEMQPTGPAAPLPPPRRPERRTPAGVRVLWKVLAGVFILAALVWGPYQVVTLLAHEERTVQYSFAAADVELLEIESSSGSIDIVASERSTIDVVARISDGLRRTGESAELVDGVVQLRSTCPNFGSDFCWVDYEIQVPRDLRIVIDGDNGSIDVTGSTAQMTIDSDNGSIRVRGASGRLDLTNDNGRIEATELRSPVVTADSDNGRIQLEFAAAPTTVVATTDNGSVLVVVPDDGTAYNVDASTDNGSEDTDDVNQDPDSDRTISVRSDNGSVTVRAG